MSTPAEHNLKVRAAERAQRAATVELYLQAFKCAEILSKYPETPTESDRVRFSHGLGRELVSRLTSSCEMVANCLGHFSGR